MPERTHRRETVRVGAPVRIGPVTLLPIERVEVRSGGGAPGAWLLASKEPHALVVREGDAAWAVDADARPVPLALLIERVPGLDSLLASR